MHDLRRRSKLIATLVLAWFVLFMGAAVATPWVNPDSPQMVCSANGAVKSVSADATDGDGTTALSMGMGMDCPLCASVLSPMHPACAAFVAPDSLSHALRPTVQAHIAALTAPPLPSRGPPV
jgi:hypothetical protein